jgi:hypothetical protein
MNAFLKDPRGHKWTFRQDPERVSEYECSRCGARAAFAGDCKEPYIYGWRGQGGFDQLSCDEVIVRKVHES